MLALDLINRLEELDDTAQVGAVLYVNRELRTYTVDSVAPDGNLILVDTGKLDPLETTEGVVNGDGSEPGTLYAVQDDDTEVDPTGG